MENKIYEIISSWAAIPTWYTSHPLDEERFSNVMLNLISELGTKINIEDFENALRLHVKNNPAILGDPDSFEEEISDFVLKAETIIHYESVK